ncbi:hypothetical protein D9M72_505250 [compost metagenome]
MRHSEVFHAELDVRFGIVEALGRAGIAHHARRCRLDLHQADFAGTATCLGVEVAFDFHHRMGEIDRNAVLLGVGLDEACVLCAPCQVRFRIACRPRNGIEG